MDEKYLLYDSQAADGDVNDGNQLLLEGNPLWFWNERLILVERESDDNFWRFTALDLITNETRPVQFLKSQSNFYRVRITPLANNFGFIVENRFTDFCVNLVKLKWAPGEFQLIEQFEQTGHFPGIIANSLSPSKFVLRYGDPGQFTYQSCNLDSGNVEFVGTFQADNIFEHYYDDKLFAFRWDQITTYNWKTNDRKDIEIEDDLNDLNVEIDRNRTGWIKDCLYLATRFDDANGTEKYGIAYMNLETKRWTSIDFEMDMRISGMKYFNGNLIVYTNNADGDGFIPVIQDNTYSNESKIYSIPVKQPQKLRKMAWSLVLQEFKRDESVDDPYQEAAKFLPFNSDLRAPWYKDETALEILDEPTSNKQSNEQGKSDGDASIQSEATGGKTSKSKLSQESSDGVPSKCVKFY